MLKIAVLAPTPSVSVSTAVAVKPDDLRSPRRAKPKSCKRLLLMRCHPDPVTEQSWYPLFVQMGTSFQSLARHIRSDASAFDITMYGNGHDYCLEVSKNIERRNASKSSCRPCKECLTNCPFGVLSRSVRRLKFIPGGNLPADAFYPIARFDSEGKLLNGANRYVMHLTEAQIPPVHPQGYWSLTMYDKG